MIRLNQRECHDEVSLGWVEVFKGEGPEHRGQVYEENINEDLESEWQDEHDDDYLVSGRFFFSQGHSYIAFLSRAR